MILYGQTLSVLDTGSQTRLINKVHLATVQNSGVRLDSDGAEYVILICSVSILLCRWTAIWTWFADPLQSL